MTFNLTKIEPLQNRHGEVYVIRFGVSFSDEELGPFADIEGFLLSSNGVRPPQTYTQYGRKMTIHVFSEWFLEGLENAFRTHPDLKAHRELLHSPRVAETKLSEELGLKRTVALSLRGLSDEI